MLINFSFFRSVISSFLHFFSVLFLQIALLFYPICLNYLDNAEAVQDLESPKSMEWSFSGVNGKFDRVAIQRGFKVYKEVCSACHSVKYLTFRNLQDIGYSEEQIKSLASEFTIKDGPNDDGEMYERPGKPNDSFPFAYDNEKAARAANNGAYPPDLSLIVKARHDGANYVYSLLTGYDSPPKDFVLGPNMHYNPYFAGGGKQFAMPAPLHTEGQVQFDDGTESSVEQMSRDIVYFLQWLAEPEMEKRKNLGIRTLLFVLIAAVMFYFVKRRIWRNVK